MLYDLADWLLGPVVGALQAVVDWLSNVSLVAAHGINPTVYLGPLAWLDPAWLALVKTAILCAALYAVALSSKAVYSLYLALKAGVKWW